MERSQKKLLLKDLEKKMVFLSGPRQVGKTWLAKDLGKSFQHVIYLNYDRLEDRRIIQNEGWLDSTELVILDELHKMPEWKNYLKGLYDTKPEHLRILVTGSARLETFRQSGDSLAGRFFRHRLLPLSPAEVPEEYQNPDLPLFLERGGFPEPFLAEEEVDANRWRMQYIDGLIREDVLDFEKIQDFRAIQMVLRLLRQRVGSPVSYSSIAEDVKVSPNTVKHYIQIMEALYIVFRVTPHSHNIARSILKEPKIYFFDTGMVEGDEGARLENLVAVSLLKHAYGVTDYEGIPCDLRYMRTKDKREVDFCLVREEKPKLLIEVKLTDTSLSKALIQFHQKYEIPAVQLVLHLKRERKEGKVLLRRVADFLRELSF